MGTNESYVDDLLRVETNEWQTHSDATLERLESAGNQKESFTFAGIHITEPDNLYHIDDYFYMAKTYQIPSNAEFSRFASMRIKLTWLTNTRPYIVL